MNGLVLEQVSKSFGGVHAVQNLSLQVAPGAITGLIGPNGAGKSTVVNLITGMFPCSSGRIRFGEQDLTGLPPHRVSRSGIARTFQNIRLLVDESVRNNVLVGYHRHETAGLLSCFLGLPSARASTAAALREAEALLRQFGLAGKADTKAGALSYGDQRRVEMVRALITRPRLLLLDEPVAGMNEVESQQLGDIFEQVAAAGVAVLLIEHDLAFVSRLCSHVYAVDQGALIAQGSSAAVLADPAVITAYVGTEDA